MREELFWSKVNKRGKYPHSHAIKQHPEIKGTRCWEWLGYHNRDGYAIHNKSLAHRLSWSLHVDRLLDETGVRHKCDVRNCVRPLHLFEGSAQVDADDKVAKRRQSRGKQHSLTHRGEKNGNAILTDKQALKVLALATKGHLTQIAIAKMYKISPSAICDVVRRRTFKHLDKI